MQLNKIAFLRFGFGHVYALHKVDRTTINDHNTKKAGEEKKNAKKMLSYLFKDYLKQKIMKNATKCLALN